jgi:hypothetical protein
MDAHALAESLAEHVNGMTKAQYLFLSFALHGAGGSMSFTAEEFDRASISALPGLHISINDSTVTFELRDADETPSLN